MATERSSVVAAVPAAFVWLQPTRLPLQRMQRAFTIVELLVVITIILVVAGLILATSGYVQSKAKRSRAEAEIAALSAVLENYKADNAVYPQHSSESGGAHALYQALAGDGDDALGGATASTGISGSSGKVYMPLKSGMAEPNPPDGSTRVIDPWKSDYKYISPGVNNPTFDLWSTGPPTSSGSRNSDPAQFIKNW